VTETLDSSNEIQALWDRDESILAFNERVLSLASEATTPLLERLRFVCIVSSNLDEFFEVRAADRLDAPIVVNNGPSNVSFDHLMEHARELVERQYALFNDALMPELAAQGIELLSHGQRNPAQREWVKQTFDAEVRPLLVPVALDPAHPFPQVANKSLNFIVQLSGKDAHGRRNDIAIVRVPRTLPRIMRLPTKLCAKGQQCFVSLSSLIRAHLDEMFPQRKVTKFSQFRVTRHSDLEVSDGEQRSLRQVLREGLHERHYGKAVRLEVSAECDSELVQFLLEHFALPAAALFRVPGPVNLVRFMQMVDLCDAPKLKFTPVKPVWPAQLPLAAQGSGAIFERMRQGDVLMHHPFESFEGVISFLREAVNCPNVLSIRQTIYRTGSDTQMLDLYKQALRAGKEVLVVVELKARFDEEANINWAESLERMGAQVVYGVMGLKTHAKMLMVTRREGKKLVRYAHLGTGNYNPRTARLYTDLSMLTADTRITADMDIVFRHLASSAGVEGLSRLLVAPFNLQTTWLSRLEALTKAARKGVPCRLIAKMNALTDPELIQAVLVAAAAGVEIDLIVRGACMLPVSAPAAQGRVRVRSIVGRFLEHSRIFYFREGERSSVWLSSADWMSRNMLRRIELAWRIQDEAIAQRVIDECLMPYLLDNQLAWHLGEDGVYSKTPPERANPPLHAHNALMRAYGMPL
jgi:polyphosphate kinase